MRFREMKGRQLDYWVEYVRRGCPEADETIPRYHRGRDLEGLTVNGVQIVGGRGLTGRLRAYLAVHGLQGHWNSGVINAVHPLAFDDGRTPNTNTMKTSELTGAELDYWVAKAEGFMRPRIERGGCVVDMPDGHPFHPSSDWAVGGPIIERESIGLSNLRDGWFAGRCRPARPGMRDGRGPTPLVAAMRCYVASRFGDDVPDGGPTP